MMTMFRRSLGALVAAASLVASTAAVAAPAANPAAKLSVARAGAPMKASNKIGAEVPTTTLISIGILAALTAVVLLVVADDDDDSDSN